MLSTASKYATVAMHAVESASHGMHPLQAWQLASLKVFPHSLSRQRKGCPKSTFLGLAQEGELIGIPSGRYTNAEENKRYALTALSFLRSNPLLANDPKRLWIEIMRAEGYDKVHNHQMEVVAALWHAKKFACQAT